MHFGEKRKDKIIAGNIPPWGLRRGEKYGIISIWRSLSKRKKSMNPILAVKKKNQRNTAIMIAMLISVFVLGIACLFSGSSSMSVAEAWDALAAIVAGVGPSVSGLIM